MLKRYRDTLYKDALRRRFASGPPLIITTTGSPVITTSGGRTYYTFNNNGSFQNNIPVSVDYIAIGGGGGGGYGGGGAGGLQQAIGYALPAGTRTVNVGRGGLVFKKEVQLCLEQ